MRRHYLFSAQLYLGPSLTRRVLAIRVLAILFLILSASGFLSTHPYMQKRDGAVSTTPLAGSPPMRLNFLLPYFPKPFLRTFPLKGFSSPPKTPVNAEEVF